MEALPAPVINKATWAPAEGILLGSDDDNYDLLILHRQDEGAPTQAYAVSRHSRSLELRDHRGFVCKAIRCQHYTGDPPGTFRASAQNEQVAIKIVKRHQEEDPGDGVVTVAIGRDSILREMYYLHTFGDNAFFISPVERLQDDNHFYQVTPAGRPFAEIVYLQWHTLTGDQRMQYFRQMLKIVQHARMCGFVIRDVKPDNFVVLNDGRGPLVAIDLGMCVRMPRDTQGRVQSIMPRDGGFGTLKYQAPEILHQEPFYDGTMADLWGVVLIFLELHLGPQSVARADMEDQGYKPLQTALELVDIFDNIDAVNAWLMMENFSQVDREAILAVCEALYNLGPALRQLFRHGLCHDRPQRWTLEQVLTWAHMD
jgi:serine/threonine protein kinase